MIINLNLIKQSLLQHSYVTKEQLDQLTPDLVSQQLTNLGLEIDLQKDLVPEFSGVRVGKVISCEVHPNADKLQVTKVDLGDQVLDIVCGAKNCRLGLLVACATPGAKLPNDFVIKQAELRGVVSNGMLCSYSELGIAIDQDGIIELEQNAPLGADLRDYLKLNDTVYDVSITPNRGDCLSALGIARDLAAFNGYKLKELANPVTITSTTTNNSPAVVIEDPNSCPVYYARLIKNVDLSKATPNWIKIALAACGIRSIDPIVDVTNYVMLTLGQPLHAFDAAKIKSPIIVRKAKDQEKLTLLSQQEVTLNSDTLIIADSEKPLALAGIFGGLDSGTSETTQDIILESAHFAPLAIIGRARNYKLHTDASHRFERGVDPQLPLAALNIATQMILDICGGQAADYAKAGQELSNSHQITLTKKLMNQISGIDLQITEVADLVSTLGIKVVSQDQQQLIVDTPSWRFDLTIPQDIAEEAIRIYGFDKIPTLLPVSELKIHSALEKDYPLAKIKDNLIVNGFQEILSYSFVDPKLQAGVNQEATIDLPNPISLEMSQMRTNLITGLLSTYAYNQKRQQTRAQYFETGLCFIPNQQAELGVDQDEYLGLLIAGNKFPLEWNQTKNNFDFYDLKGYLETILIPATKKSQLTFKAAEITGFHPGQTAMVYLDQTPVGFIGAIHPKTAKLFDVKGNVFIAQLKVSEILESAIVSATPVSKFPFNKRDLAFVVSKDVQLGELLSKLKELGGELLLDATIFDVFTNQELAQQQSVAISLTIGDQHKTMDDQTINGLIDKIVSGLTETFNASLRS